jgi:deoxyribodipyrimidine photo-lyase
MAIQSARIRTLREAEPGASASYVLYWMQQSQRVRCNHALEYAVEQANRLGLPVLVGFGLTDGYPEANARHYAFMLQGLAEVSAGLAARGIGFAIRRGEPDAVALTLSAEAALVVCDRGYLRHQIAWREQLARTIRVPLVEVESDAVVPADTTSTRHEYAARTLRPKIHRLLDEFLVPLRTRTVRHRWQGAAPASDVDLVDTTEALASMKLDRSVPPVRRFVGGTSQALARLEAFLEQSLAGYAVERNFPERQAVSHLSPYLHFGQISALDIALAVREAAPSGDRGSAAFIEELVVRRELAINHVLHEPGYDRYESLPDWACAALAKAAGDRRPHLYSRAELEAGRTHDRYWNAAMLEMRATGYMHNRMRMYWGKKIIEWTKEPEEAFATALALNNRWFLDGRDANSFANVGWLFGLHDRPWPARPVFGTVRSMGAASLKKFDADAYVAEAERLAAEEKR